MKKSKCRVVFDLDNTLFQRTWLSKHLYRLSHWFYRVSIMFQSFNKELYNKAMPADVVILTGRNDRIYRNVTKWQLKKYGIKPKKMIICPNDMLVMKWKREQLKNLKKEGCTRWFDDENDNI